MIVFIAFYLVLLAVGALALWRAQLPERLVIALFVSAAFLSYGSQPADLGAVPRVLVALLVIDLAVTIGLAWIGLRYRRTWCLVAAALQIVSTLAHVGRVIDPTMDLNVYAIMEGASSIPQLIQLAVAIWRHPRRRAGEVRRA